MRGERNKLVFRLVEQPQLLLLGFQKGVCLAQVFFVLLAFRKIAGNFAKSNLPTVVVVEGGDDDTRPKPAAVFAYAPVFVFDAAKSVGDFEFFFGLLSRDILGGVKSRKVLADNFFGMVAFCFLGAPV